MNAALSVLAAAPAVPYEKAGRFVAAAFIVLFACVLIYVLIMATKLQRLERDLSELNAQLDERDRARAAAAAGEATGPAVGAATAQQRSAPVGTATPEAP